MYRFSPRGGERQRTGRSFSASLPASLYAVSQMIDAPRGLIYKPPHTHTLSAAERLEDRALMAADVGLVGVGLNGPGLPSATAQVSMAPLGGLGLRFPVRQPRQD